VTEDLFGVFHDQPDYPIKAPLPEGFFTVQFSLCQPTGDEVDIGQIKIETNSVSAL
jgi:hypothetical protein